METSRVYRFEGLLRVHPVYHLGDGARAALFEEVVPHRRDASPRSLMDVLFFFIFCIV